MSSTLQRAVWNGYPVQLGIVWTLKKRQHVAQCVVFSHQFGWELRLEVGELFRTQVCRSTGEIITVQDSWKGRDAREGVGLEWRTRVCSERRQRQKVASPGRRHPAPNCRAVACVALQSARANVVNDPLM
jgi:hypothetical protein